MTCAGWSSNHRQHKAPRCCGLLYSDGSCARCSCLCVLALMRSVSTLMIVKCFPSLVKSLLLELGIVQRSFLLSSSSAQSLFCHLCSAHIKFLNPSTPIVKKKKEKFSDTPQVCSTPIIRSLPDFMCFKRFGASAAPKQVEIVLFIVNNTK